MSAELFYIAPAGASADQVLRAIEAAAASSDIAALLLPRGELAENAYKTWVKAVAPKAQAGGAAVLIEGEPGLVRMLGADGLHVTGGVKAVQEAIEALKPDLIVGVGDSRTRHDAMQKGETGIDYILFGPLSGAISPDEREMARWWAQTMEIPSVLSDPGANPSNYDAEGCEFIAMALPVPEDVR